MQEAKNIKQIRDQKPRWRRWLRRVLRFIMFLFLFTAFLALLVQHPKIQSWAVHRTTNFLSEKLQTRVEIESVSLNLFQHFILNDVYIEDLQGDSLLLAGQLNASFKKGIFSLFTNSLELYSISLNDAHFYLSKDNDLGTNNLTEFIKAAIPQNPNKKIDPDRPVKPFFLEVEKVHLNKVIFEERNPKRGNTLHLEVTRGTIHTDYIDLDSNTVHLKSLVLQKPIVWVKEDIPASIEITNPSLNIDTLNKEIQGDTSASKPFRLLADRVFLTDGYFQFDNYRRQPQGTIPAGHIDFDHLKVDNVTMEVEDFEMYGLDFKGHILEMSGKESSGFELQKLEVADATVQPKGIKLHGLELRTPNSLIADTLELRYREYWDFTDFVNKVIINGKFNNTNIAFRDIMYFVPPLRENAFFNQNLDEGLLVTGRISGLINRLRSRDLQIILAEDAYFRGSISLKDITERNNEFLRLDLEQCNASISTLRLLIPGFNPPANYDQLGQLQFSGLFNGFFHDFVANGALKTDLGTTQMDMRLDLKPGVENALFSGNLSLSEFDLGTLTNDKSLGKISFVSKVKDGKGLTLNTVNASLEALVQEFSFKDYNYQNIQLNGKLDKNSFLGKLEIDDENLKFDFSGTIIDFDSFDLRADIKKVDFQAINLSKSPLVLKGVFDLNLKGKGISDIVGWARISDMALNTERESIEMKEAYIRSTADTSGYKEFDIQSALADVHLQGQFDLYRLVPAFLTYIRSNFREISDWANIPEPRLEAPPTAMEYDIRIHTTRDLPKLLVPTMGPIHHSYLYGHFDNIENNFECNLGLKELSIDGNSFRNIQLLAKGQDSTFVIDTLQVDSIQLKNNNTHYEVNLSSILDNDILNYKLSLDNQSRFIQYINIAGTSYLENGDLNLSFLPTRINIYDQTWDLKPNNLIILEKNRLRIRDFEFVNGNQSVSLSNFGTKGVKALFANFDFSLIDDLWDYKPLDFYGTFDLTLTVENIFSMNGLHATIRSNAFSVNTDDWGVFSADVWWPDLESPLDAYLTISAPYSDAQLIVEGKMYPQGDKASKKPENYFSLDIHGNNYPLRYLDYFIGDLVTNTVGQVDAKLNLSGVPAKPNIAGTIDISDAATTVNYLKTRYFIKEKRVKVNNYLFDASGAIITDELGNQAVVTGGITHNRTKHMGLGVSIKAPRFLCLNTQKSDNDLFYGYGLAENLFVEFTGPFDQTDLFASASSGPNSRLSIPVSDEKKAGELQFIRFKNPAEDAAQEKEKKILKGLNLLINLDLNEQADVEVLFDEKAGDILKGKAKGQLQIGMNRSGEFTMFGSCQVVRGEYLFTFYDVINKPFVIKEAGTVSWAGNPYDADIDIDAEYEGISTSLNVLLQDYLEINPDLEQAARRSTPVKLIMHLQGSLLQPDISFDLFFPNLSPELKTYVDSRMNILKRDENELTRQVFGLIVTGSFLPSGPNSLGGVGYLTGINTLSELLSNQLSIYVTELLSEFFTDVSFISAVDFDIVYNIYETTDINSLDRTGSELQLRMRNSIINDRVALTLGGNFSDAQNQAQGVFFAHDVAIEILLTEDKRYKFRFYNRSEPDLTNNYRYKTGIGLVFRREFDSFSELIGYIQRVKGKTQPK